MRNGVLAVSAMIMAAMTAFGHNHVTVDTASGSPDDVILIRAGYIPAEAAYSIDVNGRLRHDGQPAFYLLDSLGDPNAGFGGDGLTLTSDFYFATGRLDGGDFWYEIIDVQPVHGGTPDVVMQWGSVHHGVFEPQADSSAGDRVGRSFRVGAGGHGHGQVFTLSTAGTYDAILVAWDANGKYVDSAPLVVRFSTFPLPCPQGDVNGNFVIDLDDLLTVLLDFGCIGGCPGDADGDGSTDLADLLLVLGGFGATCP